MKTLKAYFFIFLFFSSFFVTLKNPIHSKANMWRFTNLYQTITTTYNQNTIILDTDVPIIWPSTLV